MRPRIVIVDDHRMLRAGLGSMLEKRGWEVVGDADEGRSAQRIIAKLNPDVVITDLSMPGRNGVDFIRQIHRQFPDLKVIVLSMHKEARFIMGSFAAGACGYVLKDSGIEEISRTLQVVLSGRKYIEPEIAEVVLQRAVAQWTSESAGELPKVSTREREVLQLIAEGKSTKEIALSLYISTKTVETHRRQIMSQLNLPSIAELTKFAIREGITSV